MCVLFGPILYFPMHSAHSAANSKGPDSNPSIEFIVGYQVRGHRPFTRSQSQVHFIIPICLRLHMPPSSSSLKTSCICRPRIGTIQPAVFALHPTTRIPALSPRPVPQTS